MLVARCSSRKGIKKEAKSYDVALFPVEFQYILESVTTISIILLSRCSPDIYIT